MHSRGGGFRNESGFSSPRPRVGPPVRVTWSPIVAETPPRVTVCDAGSHAVAGEGQTRSYAVPSRELIRTRHLPWAARRPGSPSRTVPAPLGCSYSTSDTPGLADGSVSPEQPPMAATRTEITINLWRSHLATGQELKAHRAQAPGRHEPAWCVNRVLSIGDRAVRRASREDRPATIPRRADKVASAHLYPNCSAI